jgi:rhodanese-related sulfurtransferase
MKDKPERFSLFLWLSLLVILTAVCNSCNYITGINPTARGAPGWVWSIDNSGHAIVIDRQTQQPVKDVIPREAYDIITASETPGIPVILDVRTPQEYSGGHLRDAININFNSAGFKDEISQLDKEITYIVYCRTGLHSAAARMVMEDLGFKYVINMTGGISNWEKDGLPVVQ